MKKLIAITLILVLLLPAAVLADVGKYGEIKYDVYGKWTLYFDAREYNKTSAYPMDFDIQSLDLYVFENGSCYIYAMEIKNGVLTPTTPISGMWIGTDQEITMKFGDLTYKGYIDYNGFHLQAMSSTFLLTRVNPIDPRTYFDQQ